MKNKTIIYVVAIILISIMLVVFYIQKNNENFRNIKIDKNKEIVYSKIVNEETNYTKYVPFINIKFDIVNNINNEIDSFASNNLNDSKSTISYEYNISGDYLSVVVKIEDYNNNVGPDTSFKTYVINLKKQELLNNMDLLTMFNIDEIDVASIIESDFRNYYNDIVDEGYYKSINCDYNCFLKNRKVSNYLENVNYYINDGDLIAYKPFILYSQLGDGDYFNPSNYEFMLVENLTE